MSARCPHCQGSLIDDAPQLIEGKPVPVVQCILCGRYYRALSMTETCAPDPVPPSYVPRRMSDSSTQRFSTYKLPGLA